VALYARIAASAAFAAGLDRLKRGMEDYRVALLCAERDPIACHRAILVEELRRRLQHLAVTHL
jgi:hypothetical protein